MTCTRWPLLALFCCCLAGFSCAATKQVARKLNPGADREFNTRLTMAQVYEQEGKLQKAAVIYAELLETRPEHPTLCHRYGVVQMGLGKGDEGLQFLERANVLNPDNPAVLSDLGYACLMSDQLDAAEKFLRRSYDLESADERTVNNLALTIGLLGRYEESQELFERVMSRAEAQSNLGYICAQRGEGQRAMAHYSRALDLDPSLKPAAEALVQLDEMKRDFDAQRPAIAQWAEKQRAREPRAEPRADSAAKVSIQLTGASTDPAD